MTHSAIGLSDRIGEYAARISMRASDVLRSARFDSDGVTIACKR